MYTTSGFNTSLVNAIISYMTENNVEIFPLSFLASGKYGFPETSAMAKRFMDVAHWDYFYVKDGKLWVHGCYDWGKDGLYPFDDEILPDRQPTFSERDKRHILTADLVELVRICYDTIGNVNFKHNVETIDLKDIDEFEAEYEARRNEVA